MAEPHRLEAHTRGRGAAAHLTYAATISAGVSSSTSAAKSYWPGRGCVALMIEQMLDRHISVRFT